MSGYTWGACIFSSLRYEIDKVPGLRKKICKRLEITERTLRNKLSGRTSFKWDECCIIQSEFFPDISKEELFKSFLIPAEDESRIRYRKLLRLADEKDIEIMHSAFYAEKFGNTFKLNGSYTIALSEEQRGTAEGAEILTAAIKHIENAKKRKELTDNEKMQRVRGIFRP